MICLVLERVDDLFEMFRKYMALGNSGCGIEDLVLVSQLGVDSVVSEQKRFTTRSHPRLVMNKLLF